MDWVGDTMSIQKYHVSTNLINCSVEEGGYSSRTGNKSLSDAVYRVSDYIAVEPNTSYVFGVNGVSFALELFEYTKNKNFIGSSVVSQDNYFTTGENTYFITFSRNKSSGADYWQLNFGQNILPYEPYGNTWKEIPYRKYGTETDTITTLPADLYADGNNATVGLAGNMSQAGTPSPQNPITPQETGDRTENLFDDTTATLGKYIDNNGNEQTSSATLPTQQLNHSDYFPVLPNSVYTFSSVKDSSVQQTVAFVWYTSEKSFISRTTEVKTTGTTSYSLTATAPNNAGYAIINYTSANYEVMLNTGSTALPYEPYGYKIPISSGNTTTPVYLGEVESTRRIKKLVLTGEEDITSTHTDVGLFNIPVTDYLKIANVVTNICTHYLAGTNVGGWADVTDRTSRFFANPASTLKLLYIRDSSYTTVADFKSYLAAQYAAGTPVTVWYVLATPTTGIVNEPIRKIGDYADTISNVAEIPTTAGEQTFDVDTSLKPSSVEITYKGWHKHTPKEYDNGSWS